MTDAAAIIRRYYDAFNAGDLEAMLDCVTEDVRHDVNQGGARVGRDAFAEFSRRMARCYRESLTDMVIFSNGDRGAAEFTVNGEYLATDSGLPEAAGQRYRLPAGAFFQISDGRISRVTTYYNLNDWIAQVSGGAP